MSSNDQNASASPKRAGQHEEVGAPAATSEVGAEIECIGDEANASVIVDNEADIKSSSSCGISSSEIQNSSRKNETRSCQSPKDANSSSPALNGILSSQHASAGNKTVDRNNYGPIDGVSQFLENEAESKTQNIPSSAPRPIHGNSPPNSTLNTANFANRNINDSNVSFDEDHTVSRYRPQKYCAVCGDKAIACNFNAVTCESCKAFFRRNAFKEQRLKCLFDGRCVVDKVTRRFCSKCRLLKCFQIGMKREWILTDEQKQIKRIKILQNKQSKHHQQQQQVSTSVLELESRTKSSGNVLTASPYLAPSAQGPKTDIFTEQDERYVKRQRTSSSSNYDDKNMNRARKCDASTSCPDEADLLSGKILHHCTMAHQCQYCSLRLQSNGQSLHPVEQYQANYRFHPSHRQYFDYQQRQQQDYHQQQQHFRYSQHAGHHYSQTSSSAYSQHQMAAAHALKSSADAMNAAYAANIANGSATEATQASVSVSQQAMSGFACAVPQTTTTSDCCCPPFSEIFHSQHYNRAPGNCASGALPIIDHFADQSPTGSRASCGSSGGQVVYSDPRASMTSARPTTNSPTASKSNSSEQEHSTDATANAASSTFDDLELHSMSVGHSGDSSTSSDPFVKAPTVQRTLLKAPPTSLLITGNQSEIDQKETADSSSTSNECAILRSRGAQSQPKESERSHALDTASAIGATKLAAAASKQTLPDGNPIDISKHVVWNGVVYAQPAIDESEMRARVEMIDFTETERQLVYEMIEAIKFMFEPTNTDKSFNNESLDDFVYFCDAALRRLIKTVKQIRAFRILGMDDQIMLLKTACFKILLLRSCLHYHDDIEGWRDRYGRIMPLRLLKKAKSMVYDKHKEILTKLSGPLRKDRLIMGFMSLVLLFDPQDNLKHTNSVGLDNLIYLCILRKYLIGTQPDPLEKYERLVEATQVINACNEEYNVFFSRNFQPEQITPLLIEIFDISINNSI